MWSAPLVNVLRYLLIEHPYARREESPPWLIYSPVLTKPCWSTSQRRSVHAQLNRITCGKNSVSFNIHFPNFLRIDVYYSECVQLATL